MFGLGLWSGFGLRTTFIWVTYTLTQSLIQTKTPKTLTLTVGGGGGGNNRKNPKIFSVVIKNAYYSKFLFIFLSSILGLDTCEFYFFEKTKNRQSRE
jgi:hypothetical protein